MNSADGLLWPLVIQIILIAVNAVFACAEIALLSLSDSKLEKAADAGVKKARRLRGLKREPAKFLATIQVGITLAGFLGSAFAADTFAGPLAALLLRSGLPLPERALERIALVAITVLLSFCTLVFGELVPKRLAMKKAETLAYAMSGLLAFIAKVFSPIVWFLTRSTNGILRLLRLDPRGEEEAVTEEEIRLLIDMGSAKGTIRPAEKELLHNVFEFDNKTADEVMTHRRDVRVLSLSESDADWESTISTVRHSFYPVSENQPDDIKGILCARDYLALKDRSREAALQNALRTPLFVPPTVHSDVLFNRMKKSRVHFAIVVDEYGSMAGIVTMADLLEQIVGSLGEEEGGGAQTPLIEAAGPGLWRVSGAAPLERVSRETGVPLPADRYGTFGGFVWGELGRIPEDGSAETLAACGLVISIEEIRDHRLERALVSRSL
ncbi:MAG: hemolysin family protein [Treponema sp.]|jgi:putative hemolysin|nr:hemolysin family protein [Treponema sp.]